MIEKDMINRLADGVYNKDEPSGVRKIIKLVADRLQADEVTILKMKEWRDIDQAQGAVLDRAGKDVGQARNWMNDAEYRQRIKVKIRANLSEGDISTINDICVVLVGDRFQGIDEGWTLPADFPIKPEPAMMLLTVKSDGINYGLPFAEIDDVAAGGVATHWNLLVDSDIQVKTEYTKSDEQSSVHTKKVGVSTSYNAMIQSFTLAGENVVGASVTNNREAGI